jgi:CheY-like chemotaxis protein
MDDELFAQSDAPSLPSESLAPWRILIVDDHEGVHDATKFALRDVTFLGRGLEFHHAYSGAEALAKYQTIDDLALIFLDVVMETDDAGLVVARTLRSTYGASAVRIVLRTGQPGNAPERSVIVEYDINDYKEKTELTTDKLFVTLIAALRSYRDIRMIESLKEFAYQRMALEAELEQSALDQLPLAIIYTDGLLSITCANVAASNLLGVESGDLLGQSLSAFATSDALVQLGVWHRDPAAQKSIDFEFAPGIRATASGFSTLSGEESGLVLRLENER